VPKPITKMPYGEFRRFWPMIASFDFGVTVGRRYRHAEGDRKLEPGADDRVEVEDLGFRIEFPAQSLDFAAYGDFQYALEMADSWRHHAADREGKADPRIAEMRKR
jgi:hypothetical protein